MLAALSINTAFKEDNTFYVAVIDCLCILQPADAEVSYTHVLLGVHAEARHRLWIAFRICDRVVVVVSV